MEIGEGVEEELRRGKRAKRRIWKSTYRIDSLRNRMDRKRSAMSNLDLRI